jgi:predicted Zn-dependent protease
MVSVTFPDPVLLRRASARLVRRPGEYGDLFLEGTAIATVLRQGGEETGADSASTHGAAARLMTPEGRTQHLVADAVDADTILSLADRLDGGGGTGLPAAIGAPPAGSRDAAPSPAPAGQVAPGRAAAAAAIRAYLEEVERLLLRAAGGTAWGTAWMGQPGAVALQSQGQVRSQQVLIATSEGEIIEDRRDWAWFTLRVEGPARSAGVLPQRPNGAAGGRVSAVVGGGARNPLRLAAIHPPAEVARLLVAALDAANATAPAPEGEMPIVLGPGAGGILFHEACGHALEGDRALEGKSALAGLFGEQVGPDFLTIVDDPTLDGLPGSRRYDDEGWRTAPTVLIERGRVVGLLLDRATARRAGSAPTGSARRETYRDLPLPRMTNTFVREGRTRPGEIVSAVSRGLYVEELGAGQVDTATGEFTFQVRRGALVAGGRLVAASGPCAIIGNGLKALAGVRAIGTDLRFDSGAGECGKDGQRARAAVGQPTLLVEGLVVQPAS